ncbi:MAG: SIMPL domain-containing protein, partial [Calditrichaeota bacterium]|nr:SIMPL domain-containing protein [Calditrichota bacterium]
AGIRAAKRGNDTITVTGSARRTVCSDYVTWSGSYYANEMTIQRGYEVLTHHAKRVRDFLSSRHVPDSLIQFSGISTRDMFERKRVGREEIKEEFIGYQLTQHFDVHSTELDSIDAIARDITHLAAEGLPVKSEPPQFYYTKVAEMRVQMLGEATKDARLRAEQIAQSGGGKIGAIRNARMGVFQITAPNSREVRDYGIYDTSTIEKDITAVVTVTFAVE